MQPDALIRAVSRESPAGAYCRNRMFEWAATAIMLGTSICIFLTPSTIELGAFRHMIDAGLDAIPIALVFAISGILRCIALYLNGTWQPYGAWARGFGAIAAAFMWFQMALALLIWTQTTGTLSPAIPAYVVLTVGELVSCYRAATDEIRRGAR